MIGSGCQRPPGASNADPVNTRRITGFIVSAFIRTRNAILGQVHSCLQLCLRVERSVLENEWVLYGLVLFVVHSRARIVRAV